MWKLLQLLFFCHAHKWKILDTVTLITRSDSGRELERGSRAIMQCEVCGTVKKKDLI